MMNSSYLICPAQKMKNVIKEEKNGFDKLSSLLRSETKVFALIGFGLMALMKRFE